MTYDFSYDGKRHNKSVCKFHRFIHEPFVNPVGLKFEQKRFALSRFHHLTIELKQGLSVFGDDIPVTGELFQEQFACDFIFFATNDFACDSVGKYEFEVLYDPTGISNRTKILNPIQRRVQNLSQ